MRQPSREEHWKAEAKRLAFEVRRLTAQEAFGRAEIADLETEEHVHDVFENECFCPKSGGCYECFGEETSEQIDW